MNLTILLLAMNKIEGQTGFFNLGIATSLGRGKLNSKPLKSAKNLTLCLTLLAQKGRGKYMN